MSTNGQKHPLDMPGPGAAGRPVLVSTGNKDIIGLLEGSRSPVVGQGITLRDAFEFVRFPSPRGTVSQCIPLDGIGAMPEYHCAVTGWGEVREPLLGRYMALRSEVAIVERQIVAP